MCGTDLVQRCQVSRQVCPKVLCGFREVGDILVTQTHYSCMFVRQSEFAFEMQHAKTIIIFMIYLFFFNKMMKVLHMTFKLLTWFVENLCENVTHP